MATATAAPATTKGRTAQESRSFRERVCKWKVSKKHKGRQWVILTMPFSEARKWFEVKAYNYQTNTGEQRDRIDSWANKLRRDMKTDDFTPANWSGSLRKSHFDRAEFHDDGTVTIHLTANSPLAHIDGGHRGAAMMKMVMDCEAILASDKANKAAKEEAKETLDLINECDISVQVYLDHDRVKDNFIKLQEGRQVNKGQIRIMKIRNKDVPLEKQPVSNMALAVATNLGTKNNGSHLLGQVAFGTSATNKVGIDTLTTDSASELSCSVYGGAEIAIAFSKDAAWLEQCYVEAYKAVEDLTQATGDGEDREIPSVLARGKILCPLGKYDGKKAGSTLLVGIGNMWAYYKAFIGRTKATDADLQRLADCVDGVFDQGSGGGLDAPRKRTLMGDFAREIFDGLVLGDSEPAKQGKVKGREGIPLPLLSLMPPSSFGLKKENQPASIPDDDTINAFGVGSPEEDEDEEEEEEQGEGTEKGNVKVKPKNKKALAKTVQV